MSDKENDLIREDTVTEPETAKGGKKSKKPREKFSVWFKRNRKKILLSLTAVLALGAVLAVILVPTHFDTLNEPGDFIDLPVARLSLDSAVTVEKSGSYIAHPDSVWVDDGSEQGKIIVMYPLGHGKGQIAMRVSYDMGSDGTARKLRRLAGDPHPLQPALHGRQREAGDDLRLPLLGGNEV